VLVRSAGLRHLLRIGCTGDRRKRRYAKNAPRRFVAKFR